MVRSIQTALQNHLDTGVTTLAWCWRVTRTDGVKLGFTDHDEDISLLGTSFEASSGITASEVESTIGLNVDNLDIEGAIQSDRLSEDEIAAGLYDNAFVEIYRINWIDPTQYLLVKTGNMGELKRTQKMFVAEMRGLAHELQQERGRLFQYSCDADLGDERCKVDLSSATFTGNGTVDVVSNNSSFKATGLDVYNQSWFTHGLVKWTSGPNLNRYMEVKSHLKNELGEVIVVLWQSMPFEVQVGHTFDIIAGCDKQPQTCRDKFSNTINYQGFPSMPGNDFITQYPIRDDPKNDGGIF